MTGLKKAPTTAFYSTPAVTGPFVSPTQWKVTAVVAVI